MIRKMTNVLLLLTLLGVSFFASAATTPLSGRYQLFNSAQSYQVEHNLTANHTFTSAWYEECQMFMDIEPSTKAFADDTSVPEKCMELYGAQFWNTIWFQPAEDSTWPWPSGDGATGPLATNFGNLSIFSITEIEGDETDVFDMALAATTNGVFALQSWVERDPNNLSTWDNGDKISQDQVEYERMIALQVTTTALTNAAVNGRYSVHSEAMEMYCGDPVGGTPGVDCVKLNSELETTFMEIVFDGEGGCTIPKVSEKNVLQILGSNRNKTILYEDDYIFSADIDSGALGNAVNTYEYDANGNPIGDPIASDWGITSCAYSISNNNEMTITINEFDDVEGPSEVILYKLMLSSDAKYFKYAGGVVNDDGVNEIPSYFGMKMHETPASDVAGRTYLVERFNVKDRAYDIDSLGLDLSIYRARRYALTFESLLNDQGSCTLELTYDYKTSVMDTGTEFKLDSQGGYINRTCSYTVVDDLKKLKVTIGSKTYSTRFSDDYNVLKMNSKSGSPIGSSATDWELELDDVQIASGFGVRLDSTLTAQEKENAIKNWVDPKYWLSINNSSIVPIITSYLLF